MGVLLLIAELLFVFILTAWLLNKYGNWRKHHIVVTLSTFVGWYFSFTIIFVLPLDVAITYYNRCELERLHDNSTSACEKPEGYVPDDTLLRLWRVVYWTAQCLTWIILPLLQSYSNAGDFTTGARIKAALRNNAIYYGVYAAIFVLLLIYAIFKGVNINIEHLKVILVSASNTWGLFLLVLLLGYGMVELPRSLWNKGSRSYRLNKTYFDIDKISTEKNDAEEHLKQLYRESRRILNALKNEHGKRELAQVVLSKFPQEVIDELFPARSATEFSGVAELKLASSEKHLVAHHKKVIAAVQAHHRCAAQYRSLLKKALYLEDVVQAELTGRFEVPIEGSRLPIRIQYLWHVICRKTISKLAASWMIVMTVLILVSECTFFIVHPTLSPAALIMDYAAHRFHYKYTQFVAIGIIWYLCSAAYFTVFRLKIYKYYHLDPHKHTDENSLLFSAILLCRLTPPICLNFLGMVHLDSHITMVKEYAVETQFTRLMGHLDVIPILAKGINIYLPILILIFCALNYYKFASYVLHSVGFDQFMADDEFTLDMVSAGRSVVQLERSRMKRRADRERREETWLERGPLTAARSLFPSSSPRSTREDRIPIISADENEESADTADLLGVGDLGEYRVDSRLSFDRSPLRQHPASSNLFDDM